MVFSPRIQQCQRLQQNPCIHGNGKLPCMALEAECSVVSSLRYPENQSTLKTLWVTHIPGHALSPSRLPSLGNIKQMKLPWQKHNLLRPSPHNKHLFKGRLQILQTAAFLFSNPVGYYHFFIFRHESLLSPFRDKFNYIKFRYDLALVTF